MKNMKLSKKTWSLIVMIGAVLLILMLLLPFASATERYEERLLEDEDEEFIDEIDMTNKDAVNMSLVEYVRVYSFAIEQGVQEETAIASIVVIVAFIVFAVLTLIMSLLKKSIGIMVFDVLTLIAFKIICFDFEDRGVVPSRSYDCGMVRYLTYVIGVIIIVGAIGLMVEKIKTKKKLKTKKISNDISSI